MTCIFISTFCRWKPTICILHAWQIGTLTGNRLKTVTFYVHHAFISHSWESNLYWFPLHVIFEKGNSSTMSFSFIHVSSLAFSIIYFDYLRHASKIWTNALQDHVFLHIAGKTLIVLPPFSNWNSYLTWYKTQA